MAPDHVTSLKIMTIQELNRDIKRLCKNAENLTELERNTEFKRLYFADKEFEAMNKESIKIMFRLNLRYRIIPLHAFGLSINID